MIGYDYNLSSLRKYTIAMSSHSSLDGSLFQGAHLFEHLLSRRLHGEDCIVLSGTTSRHRLQVEFISQELPDLFQDKDRLWDRVFSLLENASLCRLEGRTIAAEQSCLAPTLRADWEALDQRESLVNFHKTFLNTHWEIEEDPFYHPESPILEPMNLKEVDAESERSAEVLFSEVETFLRTKENPPLRWLKMTERIQKASFVVPTVEIESPQQSILDILSNGMGLFASGFQDYLHNLNFYSVRTAHIPVLQNCYFLVFVTPFSPEKADEILLAINAALATLEDPYSLQRTVRDGKILSLKALEEQMVNPRRRAILMKMSQKYGKSLNEHTWIQRLMEVATHEARSGLSELKKNLSQCSGRNFLQEFQTTNRRGEK